jgi:3-hydroxyisobutyrate dehydrogenase-like beta-hydroxyacid dehydrogenase
MIKPGPNRQMRVSIVGLGDKGTPIALRVREAGWPLAFYARRP